MFTNYFKSKYICLLHHLTLSQKDSQRIEQNNVSFMTIALQ